MPPPATNDVAIVICVYTADRWDDITAAIESARAQVPGHGVIVVVDHDEALFERLTVAEPQVTVIRNMGPRGLSGARNTGVAATDAPIVAFLDDDARAMPGWLAALTAPYAEPDVVATGGRIEPGFDTGRPPWLPEELDWIVGCTYRGMPATRAEVRNVIGAGMSFRRSAIATAGGFDASVGRGRSLPLGGEETALCIRARRVIPGARVIFEPAAIVRHRVRAGRATVRYALTRAWAEGLTKARVARLEGADAGLATERTYATRTLPGAVVRELRHAVSRGDPSAVARAATIVAVLGATTLGFAWESMRGSLASLRSRRARRDPGGPLRILQVTARYAPYVGGVETHTEEVARRLAARGHRVTVATTDPEGHLPAHEVRDGVEIVRVAAYPRGRDWHLAPGLLPVIGQRRWDVVHLQGVHTLVPPLGALASILAGRRFVLTFHSGGHSSRVRTAARGLQWRLIGPLLRRADVLVGVSKYEIGRFADALGVDEGRFELIRNGSEAVPVAPAEVAGGATGHGGDGGADGPLVLSLGRLERYKGHQRVIEALPEIRRARPGTRLHVAGSGPYEPTLRERVAALGLDDAVTIAPIPHEELPGVLATAGVVALLSDYEAHPVAVMEALAARRRVVVADTTGFRELAAEGLVRAIPVDADPAVAAAAIVEELDRPVPERAPDLPTWDDTTDALEALYRRIVAG